MDQDSGMFVMQQISNPNSYVVAIRGTNSKAWDDWLKEDFDVFFTKYWRRGSEARISQATYNGIHLLLNKLIPGIGLPSAGQSITAFLRSISTQRVTISFTGHSLGGALAPTLALWFKERQGQPQGWDPNNSAAVSCTSFAGATAGNVEFADYSNRQFSDNPIHRIHNTNDMVPHAWNRHSMEQIAMLYSCAGIELSEDLKWLLDVAILSTECRNYTQIDRSCPITLPVDPQKGDHFLGQVSYQHNQSYPQIILGDASGKHLLKVTSKFS